MELIPKCLKLKTTVQGREARNIINRTEKALLNVSISEVIKKKEQIEKEKEKLIVDLRSKLPINTHQSIININKEREFSQLQKSSERQKRKYRILRFGKDGAQLISNQESTQVNNEETNEETNAEEISNTTATETQELDTTLDRAIAENNEIINERILSEEENIEVIEGAQGDEAGIQDTRTEAEDVEENEELIDTIINSMEAINVENGNEQQQPVEEEKSGDEDQSDEENQTEDDEIKERWVKNLSKRSLSPQEINLLRKGGGFAVTPKEPPMVEYITAIEMACRNLAKGQALCMRAEAIEELSKERPKPASNLTKEEWNALNDLKKDDEIMILPADKGKCLVVMDRTEYIEKMETKLQDVTTYKRIYKDPTYEIKDKLSKKLQEIKNKGEIDEKTFYKLQPTKTKIPRMYGQPKIHKENYPLREIVDSIGSVAEQIDKYISNIIKQYVGKTSHYIKNAAHFVSSIRDLRVEEDETLVSFDVVALYPSVPQEEAIIIIQEIMTQDEDFGKKTSISAEDIIALFRICVQTTYFVFNKKLYQQIDGLAIGKSSSGFAAELFMERLESKAIATFVVPPEIWKRYVDDTFSKLKKIHVENFLKHLNNQHPRIKFTMELLENDRIAFLEALVHVLQDKSTKITIYRKATHTDQYLDFRSNHHIKQKIGIISTFEHRIQELITTEEDKKVEQKHVKKALKRCGHPNWSLNRKKKPKNKIERVERRGKVVLPYVKGISENLARIFRKHDIETIHKPSTTLKNLLCNKMKDRVHPLDKTGAVYHNNCIKHPDPKNDYIGETDRVTRGRMYEHGIIDHKTAKRSASITHDDKEEKKMERVQPRASQRNQKPIDYAAVHHGTNQKLSVGSTEFSAHVASDTHTKEDLESALLCTEDNWYKRGIKEAIAIRKFKPSLNQDEGRYHLSSMYNKIIDSNKTNFTRQSIKGATSASTFTQQQAPQQQQQHTSQQQN